MTTVEVLAHYQTRLGEIQAGVANTRLQSSFTGLALILAFGSFLALAFFAVRQQVSAWWPSIPVPFVADISTDVAPCMGIEI